MAVYCLDSSSWILAGDVYRLDRAMFVHFWGWLDEKVEQQQVIAPQEVLIELEAKGQNPLEQWVKQRKERIFKPHDAEVQEIFRHIHAHFPQLTAKGKPEAKSEGDAWVIALAKARGAICVSEDRKRRVSVSFPDVCTSLGVELVHLHEFIDRESR